MVVKRRLLLAVASALTLVMTAAAPMIGATKDSQPSPLRQGNLVRLKDIAANGVTSKGAIVAVGWHESSNPGQLYLAFSTNGGKDYRRTNGSLRRYPVVGDPALGMSLDICSGRVWAGTGYHSASDKDGDSDVFVTSRTIGGGAAQALLTSTGDDRRVRDVKVACVGSDLIAIGWLEKVGSKSRAQLMLRSLEPLGSAPKFKELYNLGAADFKGGLAVAGTPASVAVAFVRAGNLRLKRAAISSSMPPLVELRPLQGVAWNDVKSPAMATKGNRLVVAFSDAGKVKSKVSRDKGETLSSPRVLANTGGIKNPSRPYSIDVVGDRIVVEAGIYSQAAGKVTPQRISSTDFGEGWGKQAFGNLGARMAALLKKKGQAPLLMEAWHNNAPKGSSDTLRTRYELP